MNKTQIITGGLVATAGVVAYNLLSKSGMLTRSVAAVAAGSLALPCAPKVAAKVGCPRWQPRPSPARLRLRGPRRVRSS